MANTFVAEMGKWHRCALNIIFNLYSFFYFSKSMLQSASQKQQNKSNQIIKFEKKTEKTNR